RQIRLAQLLVPAPQVSAQILLLHPTTKPGSRLTRLQPSPTKKSPFAWPIGAGRLRGSLRPGRGHGRGSGRHSPAGPPARRPPPGRQAVEPHAVLRRPSPLSSRIPRPPLTGDTGALPASV